MPKISRESCLSKGDFALCGIETSVWLNGNRMFSLRAHQLQAFATMFIKLLLVIFLSSNLCRHLQAFLRQVFLVNRQILQAPVM